MGMAITRQGLASVACFSRWLLLPLAPTRPSSCDHVHPAWGHGAAAPNSPPEASTACPHPPSLRGRWTEALLPEGENQQALQGWATPGTKCLSWEKRPDFQYLPLSTA